MRVVLDTNVLVSGIFFAGVPGRVLDAWADGRIELVLSPAILDEYFRVCARLGKTRPALEHEPVLAAIAGHSLLLPDSTWDEPIPSTRTTTSSCSVPAQPTRSSSPETPISWTPRAGKELRC